MRYSVSGTSALAVLTVGTATPVPTLEEVLAHPALVGQLPPEVAWELYQRAVAALLALLPVLRPPRSLGAEEEALLTPRQVADRLGVRPSRIYELTRTGRLPVVRIGKYVRVRPAALAAWLAEREVKKPLYSALSTTYNTKYDRSGAPAPPQAARADAGRVRPGNRAPLEQRGQGRARRATNLGAGRKARPPAGRRRPPPAPPDPEQDETAW